MYKRIGLLSLLLSMPILAQEELSPKGSPRTPAPPPVKRTVEAVVGDWAGQFTVTA